MDSIVTCKSKSLDAPTQDVLESANGHSPTMPSNRSLHEGSIDGKTQSLEELQADAWHKQSQPYKLPRKGKRRNDNLLAVFCQWIVDHQIGMGLFQDTEVYTLGLP